MPVRPISPQIGTARKEQTQLTLEEMLQQEAARRAMLSRFSRSGASRGSARSMAPIRGGGVRAFSGGFPNRLGGASPALQPHGPGANPRARMPWEELPGQGPGGPPRVGPPAPAPIPLGGASITPPALESLTAPAPSMLQQIPQSMLSQSGPSSSISYGNLIPLGGGAWLDLSTGQIQGQGGGGFRAQ